MLENISKLLCIYIIKSWHWWHISNSTVCLAKTLAFVIECVAGEASSEVQGTSFWFSLLYKAFDTYYLTCASAFQLYWRHSLCLSQYFSNSRAKVKQCFLLHHTSTCYVDSGYTYSCKEKVWLEASQEQCFMSHSCNSANTSRNLIFLDFLDETVSIDDKGSKLNSNFSQ